MTGRCAAIRANTLSGSRLPIWLRFDPGCIESSIQITIHRSIKIQQVRLTRLQELSSMGISLPLVDFFESQARVFKDGSSVPKRFFAEQTGSAQFLTRSGCARQKPGCDSHRIPRIQNSLFRFARRELHLGTRAASGLCRPYRSSPVCTPKRR